MYVDPGIGREDLWRCLRDLPAIGGISIAGASSEANQHPCANSLYPSAQPLKAHQLLIAYDPHSKA